jgi:hypothetical protein
MMRCYASSDLRIAGLTLPSLPVPLALFPPQFLQIQFTRGASSLRLVGNRNCPAPFWRAPVKKIAFGIAATIALGLVSIGSPASAAAPLPAGVATNTAATNTDVSAQRYYSRRGMMRRGPVCTVRKEVRRGPMGRRVVRTVRVCR